MNSRHALPISLAVGVAAIAGTVAATKTIHLGQSAAVKPKTPSALIAQRTKALDRTETALKKALKQKPPKLPPLPSLQPSTASTGSPVSRSAPSGQPQPQQQQPQRVVYVRPAPIIRHVSRANGHESEQSEHETEDGSQQESEGGFDD